MSLGVTVKQITGSQRVTQVLNQFAHCCSPDVLYKHDSALPESISTDEVFVSGKISNDIPTTVVWDNNDFTEEKLSGKGTTYVANGIIIKNEMALSKFQFVRRLKCHIKLPKQYNHHQSLSNHSF